MGEVINLREARKKRARAEKERKAERNRAKFGRTKADRIRGRDEAARAADDLDGKRRVPPSDDDGGDRSA